MSLNSLETIFAPLTLTLGAGLLKAKKP